MPINPLAKSPLGSTGLNVTPICFGLSIRGGRPGAPGHAEARERALDTVRAIFDGPINFLDTARSYGRGLSEQIIGEVIRERGGLPEGFVLATKIDRDFDSNKFDGARARQSVEHSLETLGLDHLQLVHFHDPEYCDLDEVMAVGGPIDTLLQIRDEGTIGSVGLAAGRVDIMEQCLARADFDVLLNHNRHTLVNDNAGPLIELAASRGIAVINAAPFGSGILAKGLAGTPRYAYQVAGDEIREIVQRLQDVCDRHGVSLPAAALQYSMRDPRVAVTLTGIGTPDRIQQNIDLANVAIPDAIWPELEAVSDWDGDPETTRGIPDL